MLNAIHKKTGKVIEAFKLRTDPLWLKCNEEEWIAPFPEISNWEELKQKEIFEVKVSYVKAHKSNRDGSFFMVRDYFRITTEGAKDKSENESEEHKLAKEGIYYNLIEEKLTLMFGNEEFKPSSLGKFNLEIEERLSRNKTAKIGDVVMTFENPHQSLGKGIVFEIQLSPQNQEKTEERTYDRVKQGYSVVWLWHGMFSLNELKNKKLIIIPFRTALEEYDNLKIRELNNVFGIVENRIEKIILEQNINLEKFKKKFLLTLQEGKGFAQENYKEFLESKRKEIYTALIEGLKTEVKIKDYNIKELINDIIITKTSSFIEENKKDIQSKLQTYSNKQTNETETLINEKLEFISKESFNIIKKKIEESLSTMDLSLVIKEKIETMSLNKIDSYFKNQIEEYINKKGDEISNKLIEFSTTKTQHIEKEIDSWLIELKKMGDEKYGKD